MIISSNPRSVILRLLVVAAHLILTQAEEEDGRKRGGSPWGGGAARQYREETMNWRDYAFMVFRYALFIFIICFPFWRGIRVWYLAGGRVRWRRSEGGWVTGIRFQPPDLERWLHLQGYTPDGTDAIHSRNSVGPRKLTADEVYELPEITYTKPENADDDDENDIEKGISPDDDNDELTVTHHGKDETTSGNNAKTEDAITEDANESNDSALSPDNESAPASVTSPSSVEDVSAEDPDSLSSIEMVSQKPSAAATRAISQLYTTTTISTSCSICIEDFCEGEKIRLLPCGHAFHTECILPWLTERQGCCPCCKEPVIKEEDKDNNNDEDGENNPQNSSSNENNNETASTTGRSSYMLGSRNYWAVAARPSHNIVSVSALGGNMWALPRPTRNQENSNENNEQNNNNNNNNNESTSANYLSIAARPSHNIVSASALGGNMWALPRPTSNQENSNENNQQNNNDASASANYLDLAARPSHNVVSASALGGNLWALPRPQSNQENSNENNNENASANNQ